MTTTKYFKNENKPLFIIEINILCDLHICSVRQFYGSQIASISKKLLPSAAVSNRKTPLIFMRTDLITREGFEALQQELNYLWREKRPDVTAKVAWAASLGDRSENADYQYNKKLLRETDRRIRFLRKRLEVLKVVDYSPQQDGRVFFGAWVDIENDDGEILSFRIVGPDEIYGRKDYISIDSPMARALLKKAVDDDAVVRTPNGDKLWFINAIRYR